jgi:spore coat polysaccharide biosynthesis protein SpsF
MNKTIAIVQARMGSTRFPSKVLEEIAGKPMLWHLMKRLSFSRNLDDYVVATTDRPQDGRIADFCRSQKMSLFRGQEEDVLDRYYQAAREFSAEVIVRITADCPLIDPWVIDDVIALRERNQADYASNVDPPTFPDGLDVEVITFDALQKAWNEAKLNYQREHVTSYITEHPDLFKLVNLKYKSDLSSWRLTVDEKEDLELVRLIYANLYRPGHLFSLEEIVGFISRRPEILAINRHYQRNENYMTGQ